MAKTIVGLYETFENARAARRALIEAGLSRDDISVVAANSDNRFDDFVDKNADHDRWTSDRTTTTRDYDHDDHDVGDAARDGAIAGGAIGGIGGVLLGLGLFTIPGIGVVAGAGPVVAGLIGLVSGAVSGGLLAALVEAGISEDDAEVYAEGVRRGYVLLLAHADDEDANEIARIMNRHGAIDTEQRAEYWREQGWEGYDHESEVYSKDEIHEERTGYREYRDIDSSGSATVPVIEEEMRVGKREVEAEQPLRVRTYMREQPVEEQVKLRKESIDVDRRSVDRPATEEDFDAFEEGVVEVTAKKEEAVVDKTARVVEEVTVSKDIDTEVETVRGSVRETEVDIDRGGTHVSGRNRTSSNFRSHYDRYYADTDYDYDYYEPAYRYGTTLANNDRYRDHDWNRVEVEARRNWERDNDSTWDDIKDAVRHGWNSVRDAFDGDDDHYRRHYSSYYGDSDYDYDYYAPAYRYGATLGSNSRYNDYDWNRLEPEARRNWERDNDSAWDDVKDAVRHGWNRVSDAFDGDDDDHHYRTHYSSYYGDSDYEYDYYAPAYRYGATLGSTSRYNNYDWNRLEPEARQYWERDNDSAWDDVKDAVRHGWNRVRSSV